MKKKKGGGGRVKDTDKGYASLKKFLEETGKVYTAVGVRGEKGAQKHDAEGGELTIVEIAAVHEFGTDDGVIPERSFLRSTFDTHRPEYEAQLSQGVQRCIKGESTIDFELDRLGVMVAGDVVELIREGEGIQPPLKPKTIQRKKSSHTLIDTGRLVQSIDSEVRRDDG